METTTAPKRRSVARKAGVALIWFFVVALLLTYLSRAVSNSLKAVVETGYPSTGMLDRSLEGTGKWTVGDTQHYALSFTRRITAVYVRAGQVIEAGDPLFAYDVSDVKKSRKVSDRALVTARAAAENAEAALATAEDPVSAQLTLDNAAKALGYAEFAYAEAVAVQNGGVVKATFSGTLVRCDLAVGKSAPANTSVLEVAPGGVFFTLSVTEKEAERIAVGDSVTLLTDGQKEKEPLTVASVPAADAEGLVTVTCTGDGNLARLNGEKQDWRMEKQSQKYQTLVPVAALRQSGPEQYYVLVLAEKETILGTELTVEARQVRLIEHDSTRAAIEPGVLSDNDRLITVSSKELRDGDMVVLRDA